MNPFLRQALMSSVNAANSGVRKMIKKKAKGAPAGKSAGSAGVTKAGMQPMDAKKPEVGHAKPV